MLEQLSDVQTRDLELDALEAEKEQTPPLLIETRASKAALERQLEDKRLAFKELRKQLRENELELEALQSRRRSASEAALRASTSKEASQYQNQELQFATRLEELEADTLPLMERLEAMQAEVTALEDELAELQPELDRLSAEEEARVADIAAKMERVQLEREELASGIDSALLKQYDQVRRARRGLGLVQVVDQQNCGGCNVRLPIHVLQKVRRGVGITRCPSCGRILWMPEN